MKIVLVNLKSEIRKTIINKFITKEKKTVLIEIADFLDFIFEIKEKHPSKFELFMGGLIGDAYEILKWKETLGVCHEREMLLLEYLDDSRVFNEAINICVDVDFVSLFLTNVYCNEDLSFCEKISVKNNIRNVNTNMVIMEADKLKIFDDFPFHDKKVIFDNKYKQDEYLNLYEVIRKESNSLDNYIDIIYGLSLYNSQNYKRLVLDMCIEYFLQKQNIDNIDELEWEEEYLLYLIKYANTNRMLRVITENRFIMEPLAYSYVNGNKLNTAKHIDMCSNDECQNVLRKLYNPKKG